MSHISRIVRLACLLGALPAVPLSGCSDSDDPVAPEDEAIEALRQAVVPFRDVNAAQGAGYDVVVAHPVNARTCLRDSELGAMGVHYLNGALVDDTVIATAPEVMIYEPQEDGSFEFVGVEFIIPFTIRAEDQPPPTLFDRAFRQNYTFNLWALHAWVGRDNPSGTFSDWNPDVSCRFATDP